MIYLFDYETLKVIWWGVVGLLLVGFAILDGFDLGIGTHQFHLELPDIDMVPSSYRGERGVEVRLPLFERRW